MLPGTSLRIQSCSCSQLVADRELELGPLGAAARPRDGEGAAWPFRHWCPFCAGAGEQNMLPAL